MENKKSQEWEIHFPNHFPKYTTEIIWLLFLGLRMNRIICWVRDITMVQMSTKTTTITKEADILRQETDFLRSVQKDEKKTHDQGPLPVSKQEIIWSNVILITFLHVLAVMCIYSYMTTTKFQTIIWGKLGLIIE